MDELNEPASNFRLLQVDFYNILSPGNQLSRTDPLLSLDPLPKKSISISLEVGLQMTSEVLKQANRYPSFRSPNHLRSCHVEVLYQVARGLNPSYKITRPKLVRAISVDSNETTKRKIRTQDAWRSLAKEVALMVVEIHG